MRAAPRYLRRTPMHRLVVLALLIATPAFGDDTVAFTGGSTTVPAQAQPGLDALAKQQAKDPDRLLVLEAYAPSSGSARENLRISQKRTEAVRDALVRAGADPSRLVLVAHADRLVDRAKGAEAAVVIRADHFTPRGAGAPP